MPTLSVRRPPSATCSPGDRPRFRIGSKGPRTTAVLDPRPVCIPGLALLLACHGGGAAAVGHCAVFPPDDPWNTDVSGLPVNPLSDAWITSMGKRALFVGDTIGVSVVGSSQPETAVTFDSPVNSDAGPYKIPDDAAISTSDRRVVVVDEDACKLYELYGVHAKAPWSAAYGSVFDMHGGETRSTGWKRSGGQGLDPPHDCSGLPVYPGLIRYDELVGDGAIHHALRVNSEYSQRGFVPPAIHAGSVFEDPNMPPMGGRLRLRANVSCATFSPAGQALCTTLKTYGLLLSHNGATWSMSAQADPRWAKGAFSDLSKLHGSDFDFLDTGKVSTYAWGMGLPGVPPTP